MTPTPDHPGSRRTAVVRRFLELYFADEERGAPGTLEEYRAAFPEQREAVSEAWQVLQDENADASTVLPPAEPGIGAGDSIGPYRLERLLGEGGQGLVYLATDTRLSREVAIKLLTRVRVHPGEAGKTRVQRFRREAELAARLDHPGLCPVYEADLEGGVPYIVMPHVEGPTLGELTTRGEPIDVDRAVGWIEQVARALHEAHRANVVHRDIKPGNIVITEGDQPVLMDFGISREMEQEGPALTMTGELVGTLPYMAPEQVQGEGVSPQTDVYALGATLYEVVTGKLPHDEPTQRALLNSIARSTPRDPRRFNPRVSRDLAVVLGVALERDPARRFRSAEQFADELRRVLERRPILSRPVGPWTRLVRGFQREPRLAASLLTIFLLLLGGLVTTLVLLDRVDGERRNKERALREIQLLADMTRLEALHEDLRDLEPPHPDLVPAMEAWLERSTLLSERLALHEAALASLRERGQVSADGDDWSFADTGDAWRHRLQSDVVEGLASLAADDPYGATHARVLRLHGVASTLEARSIDEHRDEWAAARERLRADPRFDGLDLAPQLGLIPLGPDPISGLEEFADLATGDAPSRDAATGELLMTDASSVVFVLLPGGVETHGAVRPGPGLPLGSPNVDPLARPDEGPLVEVRLDPFLLSKYEMTQGQWLRVTGHNPSYFKFGEQFERAGKVTPLHPVDSLSWEMADATLRRTGLVLPTSAQWEHGLRAGTTTPWSTGNEPESLYGYANLADMTLHGVTGTAQQSEVYGYDDGWAGPAPIGTYGANGFGLHDTSGNMQEWVRDIDHLPEAPPRDGDGLRLEGDPEERLIRGGSFLIYADEGRSASRHRFAPETVNTNFGVRPARVLLRP